ncbi:MAG: putative methyltransferase YcgJ [Verrucomicrobiota bacterium]
MCCAFGVVCFPTGLSLRAEPAWPQFRGPDQQNISRETQVPLQWSESRNVRWKTALPGEGWSSPVVADGRIWVTAAFDDGKSLHALCVDYETGKLLLDVEVFRNDVVPPKHRRNSHASPTGVLEGDRFYVHFGAMGTAALDSTTGRKIWENRSLVVDYQNGAGGSLTVHGNIVLIPCDGMDEQYQVGLSKDTGEVVWKVERSAKSFLETLPKDMRKAYGTPLIAMVDGKPLSLTTASTRLYAQDPQTGEEKWHVNYGKGFSNVPVPATDGKIAVICTGFMKPEVWGVRLGAAKGDISESHVLWRQKTAAPDQASPLLVDGRVYMVSSGGIASCLNAENGEVVWKERIGSDFAASPLWAAGRIYFFDAQGVTTVVKPGDQWEVLAKNTLADGCMASAAVVNHSLIVRTKAALYRIEE